MRINRQTLMKIAEDTVERRARKDSSLLAAFLCGSVLEEEYLLGGATDIDLVFIHTDAVPDEREIVRLTDEVHLDIAHYPQKAFRQTRMLRLHPWLGPTIFGCKVLYDPQHFMDFTQASVRGQFQRPDYVLERSRQQVDSARQIWMSFYTDLPEQPGPQELHLYMRAVEFTGNAFASLYGAPLTERRFLLDYRQRVEAADRGGLYPGILGLLGAPHVDVDALQIWQAAWRVCLESLPADQVPPRLDGQRIPYYQLAFEAILDGSQPMAVLWPLLNTWTQAATLLPEDADSLAAWQKACGFLGLLGAGFAERVEALDAYLDMVEEALDDWAHSSGV
jgi:predicted nucleotidyltransferase